MPRLISFAKTTQQIRDRTKTVTRRTGWEWLEVGTYLWACAKTMGLKAGETVEKICLIEVVDVRREPLEAICSYGWMETYESFGGLETWDDWYNPEPRKEGFPEMNENEFIDFFCREMSCKPDQEVTRIEFRYLTDEEAKAITGGNQ